MTRSRRYLLSAMAMIAVGMVAGGLAFGQTTGAIVGTITDADGKPLPGVSVDATSPSPRAWTRRCPRPR